MTAPIVTEEAWPELPWRKWGASLTTVHMWTQIVGKIRLATAPPVNHWWHIPLYVTAHGLTTSAMPYGRRLFTIDFDFVDHRLQVIESGGRRLSLELAPKSVASFYEELMAALRSLGLELSIRTRPVEVVEAIPFEEDDVHATYDADHVRAFWLALAQAHRLLAIHQGPFVGKASPVGFFWGSFDLATSRFSGRRAPIHPGGVPNCPPWVMEEAYSHEVINAGWWPTSENLGPAFYSYTYPEPPGIRDAAIRPDAAYFDTELGEHILRHDDLRRSGAPEDAVLEFFEDTYAAGADLGDWPRGELEPDIYPEEQPPEHAWSTTAGD